MLKNPNAIKNEIVEWIRNWFETNGKGCNAIVGISGGKDSSVVAALCVEALGKDRVIGVLMPNGKQADIDCSKKLVAHLGIKNFTLNIASACQGIHETIFGYYDYERSEVIGGIGISPTDMYKFNTPARMRMVTLYGVAACMNGRVANTCNLREDWVGYATKFGDGAGDFSPLSELTVGEVKQLGYVLGLPQDLIEKTPIDGLCGKTDEDNLGFTYDVLDRYIRSGVCDDPAVKAKIDAMNKANKHKLELMPKFILSKEEIGD